jgi:hypothetical protein
MPCNADCLHSPNPLFGAYAHRTNQLIVIVTRKAWAVETKSPPASNLYFTCFCLCKTKVVASSGDGLENLLSESFVTLVLGKVKL